MSRRQRESSRDSAKGRQGALVEAMSVPSQKSDNKPENSSNDVLIGCMLRGTYLVIAAIEEGGMGRLYRAEHQRLRQPVAVKVMARCLSANLEALARFRREAEIVSQLEHPHIVQILDFDTTDSGEPYIVMELLSGETLALRLDQIRILPLRDTVQIVVQIASGLTLAHRAGVVHRDLKPGNVFLLSMQDSSIFVKLLDFGISKGSPKSARVTGKYDVLGTPEYMAPEQALDTAKADHRADQWSLACMTYEMLTGRIPFPGDSTIEILTKVVSESPPPLTHYLPNLPISIQDVVLRGLAKDPFQRYPTIADFADRFARAAQVLISSEQLLIASQTQQIPNSAQRALTHDANHRQRTTKPFRPAPTVGSSGPKPAADCTSVAPNRRLIGRNPPSSADSSGEVITRKIKPDRSPLRAPARSHDRINDSAQSGSQKTRGPIEDEQEGQCILPAVVERADSAALPEAKQGNDMKAAQLLLSEVKRALAVGNEFLALHSVRAALRLMRDAQSPEVAAIISNATDVILPTLLHALGGQDKVISMRYRPSTTDSSINPTHMFLASRIDSPTTIEELLDVSPPSNAETLGILLDFRDKGFLAVD